MAEPSLTLKAADTTLLPPTASATHTGETLRTVKTHSVRLKALLEAREILVRIMAETPENMSLAPYTPQEVKLQDERETTESTGRIPTEMATTAMASSLYEMGGNQHPEELESKVNVEAPTGSLTKATVKTPRGKPLYPFLTMPYMMGQVTLRTARKVHVFHMQSIHIARHAVTLVTLLNETVEEEEDVTDEQLAERIRLHSELMDLDDAIKKWGVKNGAVGERDERVEEMRRQYDRFFGERFYHPDARDYQFMAKLVAYDDKTIQSSTSKESHAAESASTFALQQSPPVSPIKEKFDLLVNILTSLRDKGNPRPYTSTVDIKLTHRPYERAGVTNFKEYATYAEQMGIIRLGGDSDGLGKEWMELITTD